MKGNIYLVGFMGSGKTTVGSVLARRVKRRFVDMDGLAERRFRRPVREVFSEYGEKAFREWERAELKRLSRKERLVVATGGGIVEQEENIGTMTASGTMIHLATDLDACAERLTAHDRSARPKWQDGAAVKDLFVRREPLYARSSLVVPVDGRPPDSIAELIVQALVPEERFSVRLGDRECPVIAGYSVHRTLADLMEGRRTVFITDTTVARLHMGRITGGREEHPIIKLRPGERTKSLNAARRIYEELLEQGFHRDDLLVGVGGGVVTDLAAFVAATYKRGMGFALVSTTLLGCVDAAVGGKAAVNLGGAKNMVGCFSTPEAVLLDLPALATLGPKPIREGLVEAYKTGLVASPHLASLIEAETDALCAGDQILLSRVAVESARAKAAVVSGDYREDGLRRILNFGHTYGHAVEGFTGYRISHGVAVAWGMKVAAVLSQGRGLLSTEDAERIMGTLDRICPTQVELPPLDQAMEIMAQDKKIRRSRWVFVLLRSPGDPICVDDVSREELEVAVSTVKGECNG